MFSELNTALKSCCVCNVHSRKEKLQPQAMRTPQIGVLLVPKVILCKLKATSASERSNSLGWKCWLVIRGLFSWQSRSPAQLHLVPDLNCLDDGMKTSRAQARAINSEAKKLTSLLNPRCKITFDKRPCLSVKKKRSVLFSGVLLKIMENIVFSMILKKR